MTHAQLELIPLRQGVKSDDTTVMDVLVRITAPDISQELQRPLLNLALVIDRSGSMQGEKIEYAREAASYAIKNLLAEDRVSVVAYDNRILIPVPSRPVLDKAAILEKIQAIVPHGSTDVHGGWLAGAEQVALHKQSARLNRVLLLSDGRTNTGQTNPDLICEAVHEYSRQGISTTTMGIGRDFNEDLLTSMARSGDANYYFIASPQDLPEIFQHELQGLACTRGQQVTLHITDHVSDDTSDDAPDNKQVDNPRVKVLELFNEFPREGERYRLPNLIVGLPLEVVVRLQIAPQQAAKPLCNFVVEWFDNEAQQTLRQEVPLQLSPFSSTVYTSLAVNEEVAKAVAILQAARAREEAMRQLDQGQRRQAHETLMDLKHSLSTAAFSASLHEEIADLDELSASFEADDDNYSRKLLTSQVYDRRSGRSSRLKKAKDAQPQSEQSDEENPSKDNPNEDAHA